jgi:hypothetical protein
LRAGPTSRGTRAITVGGRRSFPARQNCCSSDSTA